MNEEWAVLADALGDRFAIERVIGKGGMATVFLARDLQSRQPLAVKVMQPRVVNAVNAERFVREIQVAGSMNHPHIVPVCGSGEADGLLYYIMPYIEGEALHHRLKRERALPLTAALQIVHDVAGALGYAHARGMLHRDVKPENILIREGRALVVDFGLTRAIGADEYRKLTETGVIVGTIGYMSPEQLREDRNLDQRADIYGLGCILYEMLTGEQPYCGPTLRDVITQILRAPVPSVQRPWLRYPAEVDAAIRRAMARSASDRFASMEEFAAALPSPGE